MHATHSASCSPEGKSCLGHYSTQIFNTNILLLQLLEAVGALTPSEAKKAAENISDGTYQKSATMPMDSETLGDYSEEHSDPIDTDLDSMAIKSSVSKVRICNIFKMFVSDIFFSQLRKIVRHVRSSPQRRQQWTKEVQVNPPDRPTTTNRVLILILDVKTRWSSTHQMMCKFSFSAFTHLILLFMSGI